MKTKRYQRFLQKIERSFFLFGARGTGKTTWLKENLKGAEYFDLLDSSLLLELTANPTALSAMVKSLPKEQWIVLDEVQKVPALLSEVHRLIESEGRRFALCGSSARKLRRSGVDLLAGRALTLSLEPFVSSELGDVFDFEMALEWGQLPMVVNDPDYAPDILKAYVDMYIKEEIREEGAVRKLAPFLRFLTIAGQINGQVLNSQNIAREAAVPRSNVDGYFSILTDTLLAHFLPAYRPGLKVRESATPKFFWVDAGIARAASGLLYDPLDRAIKGAALETLIFHELRVYNSTSRKHRDIAYYRTAKGSEVDFVVETAKRLSSSPARIVCIEVKMAEKWNRKWERAMRGLHTESGIKVDRMIGVYTGERSYHYDGLDVWPVQRFLKELHAGNIF